MRLGYSDALTKMGIQSIRDGLMAIKKTVNVQEDKTRRIRTTAPPTRKGSQGWKQQ